MPPQMVQKSARVREKGRGTRDSVIVNARFAQLLLPKLSRGCAVVPDSANFHHSSGAEQGVELLYLPAYSPNLNPIEHFWATFKRAPRQKPSGGFAALYRH
ncbi:MAG: transposase [Opitutaceae bacterium]|jgi:transposase|nr:transposase [Opitutaceae bacterium]